MNFEDGIPEENATLIVVPMMLSTVEVVRREIEKLEVRFLANQDRHLFFSLFSDYTDYSQPTAPNDAELLKAASEGIDALNARYPGGHFVLFNRNRAWSRSEQRWIGRERKRGKIEDLNAFLAGDGSSEILIRGALPLPIRSVITLDADTQLPAGSARRLIETIAHPLNRVQVDPATGTRRRGYAVIQPRISIALPGAMATRFTARLRRYDWNRSLLSVGIGRASGSIRRGDISWQSDLRCAGVPQRTGQTGFQPRRFSATT